MKKLFDWVNLEIYALVILVQLVCIACELGSIASHLGALVEKMP